MELSTYEYRQEIEYRTAQKPNLIPMFTSTLAIPERLREVKPTLFVVFNTERQRYEIHDLDNQGDTMAIAVNTDELDARCLEIARAGNIRARGKAIIREVAEANRKQKELNEKAFRQNVRDAAPEIRPAMQQAADEMGLRHTFTGHKYKTL